MGTLQKIRFPYGLGKKQEQSHGAKPVAVFFGADFYNLPLDSNQSVFVERTNSMLDFIRRHLPNHRLVYQRHPNETDEYKRLNLDRFDVAPHTIAELYLYNKASEIDYVFSACSGASVSAYAMGFNAFIFLDTLQGAVTDETIAGYHSYFAGAPDSFFITSFDQPLPKRTFMSPEEEEQSFKTIEKSLDGKETVWFLVSDPSALIKAVILAKRIRQTSPKRILKAIAVNSQRWKMVAAYGNMFDVFNETTYLAHQGTVRYSARPKKMMEIVRIARSLKKIPIKENDVIVSLANMLFEENCILSNNRKARKVVLIENRWYAFSFEGGYHMFDKSEFRESRGVKFFNYLLEPMLGLYQTTTREHKDGKVINFFRYSLPFEKIYDTTFILMPGEFSKNAEPSSAVVTMSTRFDNLVRKVTRK